MLSPAGLATATPTANTSTTRTAMGSLVISVPLLKATLRLDDSRSCCSHFSCSRRTSFVLTDTYPLGIRQYNAFRSLKRVALRRGIISHSIGVVQLPGSPASAGITQRGPAGRWPRAPCARLLLAAPV